jgi:hypothetical protein
MFSSASLEKHETYHHHHQQLQNHTRNKIHKKKSPGNPLTAHRSQGALLQQLLITGTGLSSLQSLTYTPSSSSPIQAAAAGTKTMSQTQHRQKRRKGFKQKTQTRRTM